MNVVNCRSWYVVDLAGNRAVTERHAVLVDNKSHSSLVGIRDAIILIPVHFSSSPGQETKLYPR